MFQLFAKSHLTRPAAIEAVRKALTAAGAREVEEHPYTGHAVVIDIAVPVDDWVCFLATMSRPWEGFELELELRPGIDEAPPKPDGDTITGTLQLTLMHEDGDGTLPPLPGTG